MMKTKLKLFLWEWRGVWITAPAIAIAVILLRFLGLLQSSEWAAFDRYMNLRPQEIVDRRIAIVGIDESDLENLGQATISDETYAKLLEKLKAQKPRAIGFDIYRHLPVEPGHRKLVRVFATTPNLVGIQKVIGEKSWEIVPPPPMLKAKNQVGASDLLVDADKKVRRGFLYVSDPNGKIVWSFGLHLALHYLEKDAIKLKRIARQKYQLGKAEIVPFQANDGGYVRADERGYQILINYRGGTRKFETVSLNDILSNKISSNWGKDRIILIGMIGESFQDLFFTPYSNNLIDLAEPMAGVEVHANLVSQILSAAIDGRPFIKSWSEYWENLWILIWAVIGAILIWQLRYTKGVNRFSFLRASGIFIAAGALLGSSYIAILAGWWIPVVPPFLSLVGSAIAITVYLARSAGEIRKTFGRYLTDEVVANLLESPQGLQLGGERRKITVLASDLRGFTSLSEQLSPEEVVKILNIYLGYMTDVITSYQGTIDKIMGDGIMIVFGAPTTRENDTERAVACALAMQLAMPAVNEKMNQLGYPELEMGIGINTGEAVVGNIGSETRAEYSVIGNDVNLAFRIETYTAGGQIYISESTLKEVSAIAQIQSQKEIKTKGVRLPITIYELSGLTGEYNLFLPKEEEIFFPLNELISIQYMLVEGKHIQGTVFKGKLVKLSAKEAEVRIDNLTSNCQPFPFSNIKLNLLNVDQTEVSEDIYAKILEKPSESGGFYIRFTAKPSQVAEKLDTIYRSLKV